MSRPITMRDGPVARRVIEVDGPTGCVQFPSGDGGPRLHYHPDHGDEQAETYHLCIIEHEGEAILVCGVVEDWRRWRSLGSVEEAHLVARARHQAETS